MSEGVPKTIVSMFGQLAQFSAQGRKRSFVLQAAPILLEVSYSNLFEYLTNVIATPPLRDSIYEAYEKDYFWNST